MFLDVLISKKIFRGFYISGINSSIKRSTNVYYPYLIVLSLITSLLQALINEVTPLFTIVTIDIVLSVLPIVKI